MFVQFVKNENLIDVKNHPLYVYVTLLLANKYIKMKVKLQTMKHLWTKIVCLYIDITRFPFIRSCYRVIVIVIILGYQKYSNVKWLQICRPSVFSILKMGVSYRNYQVIFKMFENLKKGK